MYDHSALYVGHKHVFLVITASFFSCFAPKQLLPSTEMWIMVITTDRLDTLTFYTDSFHVAIFFYVSNNTVCVEPLHSPFCIILDSFVKCLLNIHLSMLLPYKKSDVEYYCCHLLNQFIYKTKQKKEHQCESFISCGSDGFTLNALLAGKC